MHESYDRLLAIIVKSLCVCVYIYIFVIYLRALSVAQTIQVWC